MNFFSARGGEGEGESCPLSASGKGNPLSEGSKISLRHPTRWVLSLVIRGIRFLSGTGIVARRVEEGILHLSRCCCCCCCCYCLDRSDEIYFSDVTAGGSETARSFPLLSSVESSSRELKRCPRLSLSFSLGRATEKNFIRAFASSGARRCSFWR